MGTYSIFRDTHDPSRIELAFFCLRTVEAGEELCFDYAGNAGQSNVKTGSHNETHCLCGTASCRGIVPLY